MITLLQRVSEASVTVNHEIVGQIDKGLLVFIAVEPDDSEAKAKRLAERVAGYRIFEDSDGKMNLNVQQAGGNILVVSQFTLAADTSRGMRPGFSNAANGEFSENLYEFFCQQLREKGFDVATGIYGADMKVALINDGPATFTLSL